MQRSSSGPVVIKKYANRRLYDTGESRYVTLEELAGSIRGGKDVRVVDAASGEDLTQATLLQIIVESRGAGRLLPVSLLTQLIRMNDEALAEFLGRYVAWALEAYVAARQGAQAMAPYNPFAQAPFTAQSALARMFGGAMWGEPPPPAPPPRAAGEAEDVAALRRELDELRQEMRKPRKSSRK